MEYRQVHLRSYAKVNFGLQILGKREDGFHELRTLFQTIDLHDRIILTRSTRPKVEFTSNCSDLHPSRNLVCKAIRLYFRLMKIQDRIEVRLDKNIPIGAGLGGGSSNAAMTLLGLSKLYGHNLPVSKLIEMGARLGSDVPLFMVGGRCLGVGRGTEVYPLEESSKQYILLIVPPFQVSTAEAYRRLSLKLTKKEGVGKIPVFCSGYLDSLSGLFALGNDFESVVFSDFPELKKIKKKLLESGAHFAGLSGSGSALFGVFGSRGELTEARSAIMSPGIRLVETRTLNRAEYLKSLFKAYR